MGERNKYMHGNWHAMLPIYLVVRDMNWARDGSPRSKMSHSKSPEKKPSKRVATIEETMLEVVQTNLQKSKHGQQEVSRKINKFNKNNVYFCLLYTSPSPRDRQKSRMPSSA